MSLSLIDNEKLKDLTPEERQAVLKILSEYSIEGASSSYNTLIDEDWEETPVDIVTFLHDRRYLGNGLIDDDGRYTVFPYWEQTLQKLFPNRYDTAYNTLVLTGSIGTGKSFMAVLCMLYLLYRMICLKDPYVYYGLQPIDKITFSLMNVTLETARGVGWDKLQSLLQSSPWFLEHGTLRGTTNIEWEPPKGIELITGSRNNHIIGRAVFCLDGDTEILTDEGVKCLEELTGKEIKVLQVDCDQNVVQSDVCTVQKTAITNEYYEIQLGDGTIIKCTPEHRLMLKDGSYKEAQYLTEEDELFEVNYCI